jgi:hypothetical protein
MAHGIHGTGYRGAIVPSFAGKRITELNINHGTMSAFITHAKMFGVSNHCFNWIDSTRGRFQRPVVRAASGKAVFKASTVPAPPRIPSLKRPP